MPKKETTDTVNENLSNDSSGNYEQFSNEELQIHFRTFLEKIKGEQPRIYSALKSLIPEIIEGQTIALNFQNNTLLEEYKMRVRPALISYLRSAFNNDRFEIKENVVDSDVAEKPKLLNDSERLQQMIEKNPALLNLKSKFNLDFN